MLGGSDPVIIFQLKKLVGTEYADLISEIPIIDGNKSFTEQPPIPIYFSQRLTGIYIDSEDKNVDIATDTETLTTGDDAEVSQKGIASTITINLIAIRNSVGATLFSAMIDLIFDKVTSKEYSVTYLNGATTIFRGLITGFSASNNSDSTLQNLRFTITKGEKETTEPLKYPTIDAVESAIPIDIRG